MYYSKLSGPCPEAYGAGPHVLAIRRGVLFTWMWKVQCITCGKRFKEN